MVSSDWGAPNDKVDAFVLVRLVLTLIAATAWGETSGGPETVAVHSGSATLHAMLSLALRFLPAVAHGTTPFSALPD